MTFSPAASDEAQLTDDAIAMLADLVAFDTISDRSNLALIDHVATWLAARGIAARRLPSADGTKANLWVTIGPDVPGGVVLSGHSDVVPVEGQNWSSDPFELVERDGRLYGRGTADMKGFLALALAAAPRFRDAGLSRPVHIAISYDEEVGCFGAPALIAMMQAEAVAPSAVIVGEPTLMETVTAHKSIHLHEVVVTGKEAHSSLVADGASATMAAIDLLTVLAAIARDEAADHRDPRFDPPWSTLTVGTIAGGTAANILAGQCRFVFDLRCLPGRPAEAVLAPFRDAVAKVDAALAPLGGGAGVVVRSLADVPWLAEQPGNDAEVLAAWLLGSNRPGRAVSYGAEAGQFQHGGFPTVICGPGSIVQAHREDEYIERDQIAAGARFMLRLAAHLCAGHEGA